MGDTMILLGTGIIELDCYVVGIELRVIWIEKGVLESWFSHLRRHLYPSYPKTLYLLYDPLAKLS